MFGKQHYQDIVTWTLKGDLLWTRSTSMGLNDDTLDASDQHWNHAHHKWFYSIIWKRMYPGKHSKLGQKISSCSKVTSSNFAVALIRLLGIKARLRINQSRHQERRINRFFHQKLVFKLLEWFWFIFTAFESFWIWGRWCSRARKAVSKKMK